MFYAMMAWKLWSKGSERLPRLTAVLMLTVCLQCVKDLVFINWSVVTPFVWYMMTAVDMVAMPLYSAILVELVAPGKSKWRNIVSQEVPFVVLPLMFGLTGERLFFYAEVVWAVVYGTYFLVWTMVQIPRYNRWLRERFSYRENISLGWLWVILFSFYGILGLWIFDCLSLEPGMESIYMVGTLLMWVVICYFIYRHETVIGELADADDTPADAMLTDGSAATVADEDGSFDTLHGRIQALFTEQKIYLNPRLKLSDVASMSGTNRTYVSNFFNRHLNTTFFEYVNGLRVDHACGLLLTTQDSLDQVSANSGFNSLSTFHRVFSKKMKCTPSDFRRANN